MERVYSPPDFARDRNYLVDGHHFQVKGESSSNGRRRLRFSMEYREATHPTMRVLGNTLLAQLDDDNVEFETEVFEGSWRRTSFRMSKHHDKGLDRQIVMSLREIIDNSVYQDF